MHAKKKKWPKWKNRSKIQKKYKSWRDSQSIRCRIQNTGNQDAHIGWVWSKIEEEVKAVKSEIKKNVQGTNNDRKETGAQIIDLEQKEEINIQLEQNEETRIEKKWGEA